MTSFPRQHIFPTVSIESYDRDYGIWEIEGEAVLVKDQYRVAWRRMAATTGFRTLYPAVIPPGAAHVHPVHSAGSSIAAKDTALARAGMSTVTVDFLFAV